MARRKIEFNAVDIGGEIYVEIDAVVILILTQQEAEELSVKLAELIIRPPTLELFEPVE